MKELSMKVMIAIATSSQRDACRTESACGAKGGCRRTTSRQHRVYGAADELAHDLKDQKGSSKIWKQPIMVVMIRTRHRPKQRQMM
jgi:hypothetical protein